MKNENKWIDDLRNRMKDHSEPLPEGLWDRLEKELEVQKSPKVIPLWKRWQVAAALLVLLATSLTYWFWSSPEADFHNQKLAADVEEIPFPSRPNLQHISAGEAVSSSVAVEKRPFLAEAKSDERLCESTDTIRNGNFPASGGILDDDNEPEETVREEAVAVDAQVERAQKLRAARKADKACMERNAREAKTRGASSSRVSVGIGAGNTPYGSLNTFEGMGSFVSRSAYYTSPDLNMAPVNNGGLAYSQILLENAAQTPQTSVNHHMPVTVGLSLAWSLNEDWALETGLTYTLLSSDIHSGSKSYVEEEQKLHYVGIPLKVRRSVWRNNWLSVYASVGGAMEKCVSGRLESITVTNGGNRTSECSTLKVDPLQWSVMAAAGVQVDFTSRLGLYLEPGMAYYFDDHSNVETIRKEHPFNFNFQLGLRFNVMK